MILSKNLYIIDRTPYAMKVARMVWTDRNPFISEGIVRDSEIDKEVATKALNDAITAAKALHVGATEGTVVGNYAAGSKAILNTAIEAAEAVSTDAANKTQQQLVTAKTELDNAVNTFKAGKVVAGDSKALNDAITAAKDLHGAATEGTAVGNYAVGSKATLNTAIGAAEAVLTDAANKTQQELADAKTTLDNAVNTFKSGKVVAGNSTALSGAITTANSLHDGATEGSASGNYAVGSKATLKTAIEVAEAVLTDAANKTQKELDDAKTALDGAVATFEGGKVS